MRTRSFSGGDAASAFPVEVITFVRALCALSVCVAVTVSDAEAQSLPALNVDREQISVSGVSSGGYMAQQFHVIHSSLIKGAGVIAGGPYNCAQNNLTRGMAVCTAFLPFQGPPAVEELVASTEAEFDRGAIDNPTNLHQDKVYLFSGANDEKVPTVVTDSLKLYYRLMGVDDENIVYVRSIPAAHGMVTDNINNDPALNACAVGGSPFINDCRKEADLLDQDADVAGAVLRHIHGLDKKRVPALAGHLVAFSQTDFIDDFDAASMDPIGHIYVPGACADGARCSLHVAFHGCNQNDDEIGDAFVTRAGYNEWAEANNIIVLYPQVEISQISPFNPQGCWDFWGYTDENYHRKWGLQVAAVRAMINHVAGLVGTPAGVKVERENSTTARLSWTALTAPKTSLAGYNVYRSETSPVEPVSENRIAELIGAARFVDADLTSGRDYFYVVTAVDTAGNETLPSFEAATAREREDCCRFWGFEICLPYVCGWLPE